MNRSTCQIWKFNIINLNSKQTYNVYFKYKEMTTIKFKPLKNRDNIVLEVMSNKLKSHTNTKSKLFGSLSD